METWRVTDSRIGFQVRVVERDEIVVANAFVTLASSPAATDGKKKAEAKKGLKAEGIFAQYEKLYASLPGAAKEDNVKKVNGVFQFEITDGPENFFIDLKNELGAIGKGTAPRPDIVIKVKDDDFISLVEGKLSGQQAFMKGKLQVKGNMMLAMKLDRVLKTLGGGGASSKI